MGVVIRTQAGDPAAILPAVRQRIAAIDPDLPIVRPQTLTSVGATAAGSTRLSSVCGSQFAVRGLRWFAVRGYRFRSGSFRRQAEVHRTANCKPRTYGNSELVFQPLGVRVYSSRSCSRPGRPYQNSICSGTTLNPPQKGGLSTVPPPNLVSISA
jgi:hypothetical protein